MFLCKTSLLPFFVIEKQQNQVKNPHLITTDPSLVHQLQEEQGLNGNRKAKWATKKTLLLSIILGGFIGILILAYQNPHKMGGIIPYTT